MLSGRIKNFNFHYILDKINGRLVGCTMNIMGRSRRVTLAKSVMKI